MTSSITRWTTFFLPPTMSSTVIVRHNPLHNSSATLPWGFVPITPLLNLNLIVRKNRNSLRVFFGKDNQSSPCSRLLYEPLESKMSLFQHFRGSELTNERLERQLQYIDTARSKTRKPRKPRKPWKVRFLPSSLSSLSPVSAFSIFNRGKTKTWNWRIS